MSEHIQKRKDKSATAEYRDGWDRIFGKKLETQDLSRQMHWDECVEDGSVPDAK